MTGVQTCALPIFVSSIQYFRYNRFVKISGVKDWVSDWRSYLAEFLGTFLFVLISSFAVLTEALYGDIGVLEIGLVIGFSYTCLIFTFAHLGGGYLNPAITISLWLVQRLSASRTVFFLTAQLIASFMAAWVLLLFFGADGIKYALGSPSLGLNISLTQAVLAEAVFTAGLVLVLFSTIVDRRGPISFGPLALGLYLVATSIILISVTGAALNPARVIGPAIVSKSTNTLAVWIIGPLAGSLIGIVYELVFLRKLRK